MRQSRHLLPFFIISTLLGTQVSQSELENSIRVIRDAQQGITSSADLTTHLILVTQNLENISIDEISKPEKSELFPKITTETISLMERPALLNHFDIGGFRIHYDLTGINAIDTADGDGNGRPDYLDLVIDAIDDTREILLEEMGYSMPPPDNLQDQGFGGSSHYDIYLMSIGSDYYGWTQPENLVNDNPNSTMVESNAYTSYIVLRNNYSGFPNSEMGNIQVTLAHEVFHAIQFGYDFDDEIWFMEATATWMEDQAFTDVNDCYNYMPGWFKYPHYSLHEDKGSHTWYGTFIFFQYISENLGGSRLIKDFWERSVTFNSNDTYSTYAFIDEVLAENSSSISNAMSGMVIANWMMTSTPLIGPYGYTEAESYNVSPAVHKTIDYSGNNQLIIKDSTLHSFGSRYYKVNSDVPIQVNLLSEKKESYELRLYGILKNSSGLHWVQGIKSGESINITPGPNAEYLALAVVSTAAPEADFEYTITIEPGTSKQPFLLTDVIPEPFITSRYDSCKFSLLVYADQELELSILDRSVREIKSITKKHFSEGIYTYGWDGRQNDGFPARSGTYFIRASSVTGNETAYREFTLISSPEINISNPYPNPSSKGFEFTVIIGSTQFVTVKIVDVTGRTVAVISERPYSPGELKFTWDGRQENGERAPSGIYLIGVEGESGNTFQKVTLIR